MYLAIDFGGTNIKTGVFSGGAMTDFFTMPAKSHASILSALLRVRSALFKRGFDAASVTRAGIAIPGVVDPVNKKLLSVNHKFDDAVSFDFEDWFRVHFGCPLVMENDANAALYGEIRQGCAIGAQNAVLMTLGTGIGTAAVIAGKLLRGVHYQAGILGGHLIVDLYGKPCTCGGRGCLETLAGSRELGALIPRQTGYGDSILGRAGKAHMKALMDGCRSGDAFCLEMFEQVMDIYAAGIINLIHAYDPETVILSGGVLKSEDLILPALKQRVDERAWMPWGKVSWSVAKQPDRSVLLGLFAWMSEEEGKSGG